MTTQPKENRSALLAAVLARALPDAQPHLVARAVVAMQTAAKAHKRAAENACSYPMTEAQTARADKRCAHLQALADVALCAAATPPSVFDAHRVLTVGSVKPYKGERTVRLMFGGDPRGPCGWLKVSDMPGDGWDHGFAIYE